MMLKGHKFRVGVLLFFSMFMYVIVLIRLGWVQLVRGDFFSSLGSQQYLAGVVSNTPRGCVYDRANKLLVMNKEVFSAFVLPHSAINKDQLFNFLHRYYPLVFDRIEKYPDKYFFWLDRRLSSERLEWLKNQNLNAIQFANESARFYPYKELSHVVGFTDIDNKGIAGLELAFDKKLAGESSKYRMARDARAKKYYFEKVTEKQGTASDSIKLTLDYGLQFLVGQDLEATVKAFNARQGAAIVLDPFSGQILTMVSYPYFDANDTSNVDLSSTKNVSVSECYEVGSVMKTFSALAGLADGVVEYEEVFDCGGLVSCLEGLRVQHHKVLGKLPFHEAVRQSSNLTLAKVGLRLGARLYDHFTKVGFGRKTYLGFPGERPGFVNPPKNWSRFSPMVMTFGYEVTVTLLQIARAMSVIANGGYYIEPFLVFKEPIKSKLGVFPSLRQEQIYSDETLELIISILEKIGSGFSVPGFKLKGKTGTAKMLVDGKYSSKKHIYTFAGFVEKGNYRRVIVTFIKEPEKSWLWASQVAAPLAKKIAERLAIRDFNNGVLRPE